MRRKDTIPLLYPKFILSNNCSCFVYLLIVEFAKIFLNQQQVFTKCLF
jgi:hypothetical protein